jgi:DMSO/TMAO reductase YedYZ molybdopterin-dependent catalytic subunit
MPNDKVSRRQFLKDAGILLGGAALGSLALTSGCSSPEDETAPSYSKTSQIPGVIYSPDTLRVNRLPPGQKPVDNWPQVQSGSTPVIDINSWTFTISGQVDKEISLNYQGFTSLASSRVLSDIHCVTSWTRLENLWEGIAAQTIAALVRLKPEARFVIIKAQGGFTANVALADFLQPDVLFALKHDDAPLSADHGAPVRLVLPRLYFWKSAKWVTGIEFTSEDRPGFWERLGYHNHADPWKEERYS